MKRLVLIRHGESLWNAEGRVQGQQCAGLSVRGRQQADLVAAAVAASHPVARLVTSDLRRARETTEPLAGALGVEPEVDAGLRERTFGAWEGLLREDVARQDPTRWRRFQTGEDVVAEIGGESREDLASRSAERFRHLLTATPEGGITIAVAHGGTIWYGVHELLDLAPLSLGGVANASVAELVSWTGDGSANPDDSAGHDHRTVLERWNELAHLPATMRTSWRPRDDRRRVVPDAARA